MQLPLLPNEVFGFVRPSVDAHALGISYVAKLLRNSGYRAEIAGREVTDAVNCIRHPGSMGIVQDWIRENGITRLGLSYRLDPNDAVEFFGRLYHQLKDRALFGEGKSQIRGIYFAGLPSACKAVAKDYGRSVPVFIGDETPVETLSKLGVPAHRRPEAITQGAAYDELRMDFAQDLISSGRHLRVSPEDRSGYPEFGTQKDHVVKRIAHAQAQKQSPLMRVHVGPYDDNRELALLEFQQWLGDLSAGRFLDIVSIGTSQLTQERFGEKWGDLPNGGGVPVNSAAEYRRIWEAARPMLVRTYAGTQRIPELARIHEESLNIAWHALSFWWFSQIDGRGPNTVLSNLQEHLETLDYVAASGKPFEPNIPHHFAFRGGDDVSYVLSAYLAARTAKAKGIRYFILQNMLNTPKYTWGVQDLAKSRAMLQLVRELEDSSFQVILQPRAGLDYFSADLDKARIQLAAVSAMMDDIEPDDESSPGIIHVVSYSEASHLADPKVINESIQIARQAVSDYRKLRECGEIPNMASDADVSRRTAELIRDVRVLIESIERAVPEAYSAKGLYLVLAAGYFAVPYLWECREEFKHAVRWNTDVINGGVSVVDEEGVVLPVRERVGVAEANLETIDLP